MIATLITVRKIVLDDGRETPFKDGMPGKKWLAGFMRRHPELSERKPELLGGERAVVSSEKIDRFYADLHDYLEQKGCLSILSSPDRMFNCDETGFALCGKMCRVLATKGSRTVSAVGSSDKSQVTVLATISASGDALPPTIVLAGKRFRENPLENGPKGAFLGRSDNGWMNSEVFYEYVANSFIPWLEEHKIPKPVLLLVDGHSSHVAYHVGQLCNEAGVELYPLPSHASHVIQPCDVSFFKPLKSAWARAERQWRQEHGGTGVTKYSFASAFRGPWEEVAKRRDMIRKAFRATGLFPFSREFAREKLAPSSVFIGDPGASNAHAPTPTPGSSGDAGPSTTGGQGARLTLDKHLRYPVINRSTKKRKTGREDLPKCISSDAYLQYLKEKQDAKEREEERKKKRKEEREAKKAAKEGGKRKEKKKNVEAIDENVCPECAGRYDDDPEEWVGCSYCTRWFHVVCCDGLDGLTDEEIEAIDFKCRYC
ncbi:uncharacterized protein [Diadema setosum]|uniref:uncharacterized protein n=1 Tax=Diadema setosum TaxID=31175 RepID=UPI003B3AF7D5